MICQQWKQTPLNCQIWARYHFAALNTQFCIDIFTPYKKYCGLSKAGYKDIFSIGYSFYLTHIWEEWKDSYLFQCYLHESYWNKLVLNSKSAVQCFIPICYPLHHPYICLESNHSQSRFNRSATETINKITSLAGCRRTSEFGSCVWNTSIINAKKLKIIGRNKEKCWISMWYLPSYTRVNAVQSPHTRWEKWGNRNGDLPKNTENSMDGTSK